MKSFAIKVTSETRIEREYKVKIIRDKNSDASLSAINLTSGSINLEPGVYEYTLEVENNVSSITVNGYNAIASVSEEDVYEIVITDLVNNEIVVTAEDEDASVSIRGKLSEKGSQTLTTTIPKGYLEVPIKVTSESGKAREYTLKIYTPDELLELKTLKVNNSNASKQEDGTYKSVIADDISRSSIYAEAKYSDNYIGINGSE